MQDSAEVAGGIVADDTAVAGTVAAETAAVEKSEIQHNINRWRKAIATRGQSDCLIAKVDGPG